MTSPRAEAGEAEAGQLPFCTPSDPERSRGDRSRAHLRVPCWGCSAEKVWAVLESRLSAWEPSGEVSGRAGCPRGPPDRPAVEGPGRVGSIKAEPHLCSQPPPLHRARPSPYQLFTADFIMKLPEGARIPAVPTHCPAGQHPVRLQ